MCKPNVIAFKFADYGVTAGRSSSTWSSTSWRRLQPDPLLWQQKLPGGRERLRNFLGFVHVVASLADMNKILPRKVREGVPGQCRNRRKIVAGLSGASYIVAVVGNDKQLGFGSSSPPPASFGFLYFRVPCELF
ncbi:hypothetical protein B0H17DRAFT_1140903 [Mycena rosella]|uniref:Uncharacterized protein n=1 Tax=Mycena rosella TaxID=1033263 RepID=A0AAD7D0R0_MYCRO|nr:hypothetical protein B0H17DRAFT_1140903 [Mycena rosella]